MKITAVEGMKLVYKIISIYVIFGLTLSFVMCAGMSLALTEKANDIKRKYKKCTAAVLGVNRINFGGYKGVTSHNLVIQYEDNGNVYNAECNQYKRGTKAGDTVKVLYNSDNKRDVVIEDCLYRTSTVATVFSICLAIITAVCIVATLGIL